MSEPTMPVNSESVGIGEASEHQQERPQLLDTDEANERDNHQPHDEDASAPTSDTEAKSSIDQLMIPVPPRDVRDDEIENLKRLDFALVSFELLFDLVIDV